MDAERAKFGVYLKSGDRPVEIVRMFPTDAQARCLYRVSFWLTYKTLQPIHLVCIDPRTGNLYVLAGETEEVQLQIKPDGELI
jgi:hypothetical protein